MQGKTVIITGATSGIGEVAALRLAEQGARIVFVFIVTLFANNGPTATDWAVSILIQLINLAVTGFVLLTRK